MGGNSKSEDRRYRFLVIVQLALLFLGLSLSDLLFMISSSRWTKLLIPFFLVLGLVYVWLIWLLLRAKFRKGFLRGLLGLLLFIVVLLSISAENPFYRISEPGLRQASLFAIHTSILLVEALLIYKILIDVFGNYDLAMSQRLWRTSAVYLLMAIAFGSVYDLMVILNPEVMGKYLHAGFGSYAESMVISLSGMLKLPMRYMEALPLVKKVLLLQSVWNDLFIALLVGNILAKK